MPGPKYLGWSSSKVEYFNEIEINGETLLVGPCSAVEPSDAVIISLNGSDKDISVYIKDFSVEPLEKLKAAIIAAMRMATLPGRRYVVGFCCSQGCGRTGTAAIIYMIARHGVTLADALRKFYVARGCGPESMEQKLLLGYAELLRRRGLRGEELVKALKLPKGRIEPSDSIEIGGVGVASWLLDVAPRIIRDIASIIKVKVIKAPPERMREVAREAGVELSNEDKEAMEAWRLWKEAEEALEALDDWMRSRRKTGKRKTKKEKQSEPEEDELGEDWYRYYDYDLEREWDYEFYRSR